MLCDASVLNMLSLPIKSFRRTPHARRHLGEILGAVFRRFVSILSIHESPHTEPSFFYSCTETEAWRIFLDIDISILCCRCSPPLSRNRVDTAASIHDSCSPPLKIQVKCFFQYTLHIFCRHISKVSVIHFRRKFYTDRLFYLQHGFI